MIKALAMGTLLLAAAAAQAQDPHWPTPVMDSVPPELPEIVRPAVLIVSKTNGFRHDSIAEAVPAIERLAAARGWAHFATENAAVFNPEQLARFDLVVFASASARASGSSPDGRGPRPPARRPGTGPRRPDGR